MIGVAGAIIGDQITFRIGRSIGYRQFAWMRSGRAKKVLDFAARKLETSGALLIFTARYIPLGRVAVNLTAGATGYSYQRFTFFDVIGCITWGGYSVGIGAVAGNWLSDNKLLGVVLSVAIAWCWVHHRPDREQDPGGGAPQATAAAAGRARRRGGKSP